jgi:two-component system chemotaxis response regulator CheB
MARTRVLVAEDSATVREMLCDVLAADPELEVVGAAADGREAIALCEALRPGIVTMDMMMPTMTGLAATEHIMAFCPTPILVVSSAVNRGELFETYDVLAAGAVDVLEKPTGHEPAGVWERKFVAAVKLAARIRVITHLRARSKPRAAVTAPTVRAAGDEAGARVLAIGASTGGPGAVVEVLRGLPVDVGVPVLFVLHINPQFGHALAEWLDQQTPWPARFAVDNEPVVGAAGQVVIAPADRHMLVRDGRIRLDDGPERHSCRPSVDVLFESLAREYGRMAGAALLTGMGRDGAQGLLAMRVAGATTFAQDEASSIVYGMPREAVLIDGADRVLPIGMIGPALARLAQARKVTP